MLRAACWLISAWLWAAHTTGAYGAWSRLWRWLERRQRSDWPPIPPCVSVFEVGAEVERAATLWTPDRWWRLWDSISIPERLEARMVDADRVANGLAPKYGVTHSVDCDEFATWSAAALSRLVDGPFAGKEQITRPLLLQVLYVSPGARGKLWYRDGAGRRKLAISGHHVCAFRWLPAGAESSVLDAWARGVGPAWHLSNWGLSVPRFGEDHDSMSWLRRLAEDVAAGQENVICAWVVDPVTLRGWARVI